jgi:hypothetical protein
MTLDAADLRRLRSWIAERIPEGGSEADTAFTDQELIEIAEGYDNLYNVAAEAWRLKAGWVYEGAGGKGLAVEKSVGSEKLKFATPADRHAHFLEMADYYDSLAPTPEGSVEGSAVMAQEQPDVLGLEALRSGECDISRLIGYDC